METPQNIPIPETSPSSKPEMDKIKGLAKRKFNIYSSGITWGLMSGLLMGIYLIFLNMFGIGDNILLNFLKYIFMALIFAWGLSKYRDFNLEISFFQKAFGLGMLASAVAAVTLVIIGLLTTAINPDWAFNQYYYTVDTMGDAFAADGTLIFETIVAGGIITFICIQYLKGRDEHVVDTEYLNK
jgi:hypothetical protein